MIKDFKFQKSLKEHLIIWSQVKEETNLTNLQCWELIVKPNIKKLLIHSDREMRIERNGELNLLLIHQCYLVKKVQSGDLTHLCQLKIVQSKISKWYDEVCAKVKVQSKCEEIDAADTVRIYHHEMQRKHLKRSLILKLEADGVIYE